MQTNFHQIIVLGAGISGLSAAIALQERGKDVLVLEKDEVPGGVLQSFAHGELLWDRAAHTIAADKEIIAFLSKFDLDHLIEIPESAVRVRQLAIGNEIYTIKNHPLKILSAPYLSTAAKFKLLKELFKKPIEHENPTVEAFFTYHFGSEITRNIVSAVFSGIYAGDISQMEMKSVMPKIWELERSKGSLLRGLAGQMKAAEPREIIGIRGGMYELGKLLASKIENIRFGNEVVEINKLENGYSIKMKDAIFKCEKLISTIPAYALSPLVKGLNENLSLALSSVAYSPLALLHVVYPEQKRALATFGFLCSQFAGHKLKGAIYNSDLFPDRAGSGSDTATLFMDYHVSEKVDGDIDKTIEIFKRLAGIKEMVELVGTTKWKRAIPQFNVPYSLRKQQMLELAPFELSGSYISGVSVTDCIKYNLELAQRLS